jgi:hypothetical protein
MQSLSLLVGALAACANAVKVSRSNGYVEMPIVETPDGYGYKLNISVGTPPQVSIWSEPSQILVNLDKP